MLKKSINSIMKTNHLIKVAAVVSCLFMTPQTYANAFVQENFYIQGDLGVSRLDFKTRGVKYKESNFNQRVSIGYSLDNFRIALDWSRYGNEDVESTLVIGNNLGLINTKLKFKAHSFGTKLFYDFKNDSNFTPYVGIGLSYNFIKAKYDIYTKNLVLNKTTYKYREKDYKKPSFIALIGFNYNLTNNLKLNTNIEYEQLGKFSNIRVNQTGVKLGLGYYF